MNETISIDDYEGDMLRRTHAYLMAHSSGLRNDDAIACMLASLFVGDGAMPLWLGLNEIQFTAMIKLYYPGSSLEFSQSNTGEVEFDRSDEQGELYELLVANRADSKPDLIWMAHIVTAGCMGSNHLWQDLGLWERPDLTNLMNVSFPDLAKRNDKNMKWKKFLYKQLCQQEGIYTCRSPSCEVCAEYKECFAPE